MSIITPIISHRRLTGFGQNRLILGRSVETHLSRLRQFCRESCEALDCDIFLTEF